MGSHVALGELNKAGLDVTDSSDQTYCLPCAPMVSFSVYLDPIGLLQLLGSVVEGQRRLVVLGGLLRPSEVSPAQEPLQDGLSPLWCTGRHSVRRTAELHGSEDSWIMERNQGSLEKELSLWRGQVDQRSLEHLVVPESREALKQERTHTVVGAYSRDTSQLKVKGGTV